MIPGTQKNRPIGFILWNATQNSQIASTSLVIRPEELTHNAPSRNAEYQTLNGAWLDGQGPGLETISISGHTGWRGTADDDGEALFRQLHDTVFADWHAWRKALSDDGQDPNNIELIFLDDLNNMAKVVSPGRFQLRRHKTRPLLFQFNIEMTVLRDASESVPPVDTISEAINNPRGRYRASSNSLKATLKAQEEWSKKTDGVLGFSLTGVSKGVLNASTKLLKNVTAYADTANGYIDATMAPLLTAAVQYQAAARNAYQVMAMPAQLTTKVRGELMFLASTFNDAYCTLINGFGVLTQFPDFSDLYGASTCSSTGGGLPPSPYQGKNPFLSMYPLDAKPVSITRTSGDAMKTLGAADPLSLNSGDMPSLLEKMSGGVSVGSAA